MSLQTLLYEIYEPFGNEWVTKNSYVFSAAKRASLSLAGSIAISIGRKKAIKNPGDIDYVCSSVDEARKFITDLEKLLFQKSTYWSVQTNSKTAFCPEGCSAHFRIKTAFWLPICVMVIPEVHFWRVKGGHKIQSFDDVVESAKLLEERDGKDRTSHLDEATEDFDDRKPARAMVEFDDLDLSFSDSENPIYQKK